MTRPTTGHYCTIPGRSLQLWDYIKHNGTWYRLVEHEGSTRNTERWLGRAQGGAHMHLLLDANNVTAYVWDR